jgi:hypothetical protein
MKNPKPHSRVVSNDGATVPVADIQQLVNYLRCDEELHYTANRSPDHIFRSVRRVATWLERHV